MAKRDIRFATPKAPREQQVLFPQYLDDAVAPDAPVRTFVELMGQCDWTTWEQAYEGYGQPPIHPRYLASAILYGLMHKVRSTRELEAAACNRLDFIWMLEGFTPDHSTFADFRLRHAKGIEDLQKHIAKELVTRRETELLLLLIDGTRMRADSDWHGARAAEYIAKIICELDRRMEEMLRNSRPEPPQTDFFEGMAPDADDLQKLAHLDEQIARLQKQRDKYQKALDTARRRDERAQRHDGKNAKPVRVPVTDPDSHVLPNKEGGYAPNYTPIAAVEPQTGAIVHASVLDGSDEASAVLPAVEALEALAGQPVDGVLADGNFPAGEVLEALDAQGIKAYMPIRTASPADNPALRPDPTLPVAEQDLERLPRHGGHFARSAFVYDPQADTYYCPMGHTLTPFKRGNNKDGVPCTYYQCKHCPGCSLTKRCIKGKDPCRSITRDRHEPLREATIQRMATSGGQAVYKKRAPYMEGAFAGIKSGLGIRRFTVRGLDKVRIEWNWICAAYNLKKLLACQARSALKGHRPGVNPSPSPRKRRFACLRPHYGASCVQATCHWILRSLSITGHSQNVQIPGAA